MLGIYCSCRALVRFVETCTGMIYLLHEVGWGDFLIDVLCHVATWHQHCILVMMEMLIDRYGFACVSIKHVK